MNQPNPLSAAECSPSLFRASVLRATSLLAVAMFHFFLAESRGQSAGAGDPSFQSSATLNAGVDMVVPTSDGKTYAFGSFTSVQGASRLRLARFNADGTVDPTFDAGTRFNREIRAIAVQADGKVLVGGSFAYFGLNGTGSDYLSRLNPDGSLDGTFNPGGAGPNSGVTAITIQPDGKILFGGYFSSYNGVTRHGMARLHPDGSLDTGFDMLPYQFSGSPLSIAVQSDGKVVVGGNFFTYDPWGMNTGSFYMNLTRLNPNGHVDFSFNPGFGPFDKGPNGLVTVVKVLPDDKLLIGGFFSTYDHANGAFTSRGLARLNADGSYDSSAGFGFILGTGSTVNSIAVQPDGKMIVSGFFVSGLIRLTAAGNVDPSFSPGVGQNDEVKSVGLRPDGRVVIGGTFTEVSGTPRNRVACLNGDGTLHPSFATGNGANNPIRAVVVRPDGKMIIGGDFTNLSLQRYNRLARLNSDGTLDTTFVTGTGFDWTVKCLALMADGGILVGGGFSKYNNTVRAGIVRIGADGALDPGFNPGGTGAVDVRALLVQPDGKIVIGGDFLSFNNVTRGRIARLNSDGSLDTSFNPGTGFDGTVLSLALQPDGRILVGGDFLNYNGTVRKKIARLQSNGSLDTGFLPQIPFNSGVAAIVVQPDGKPVIVGNFSVPRGMLTRLLTNGGLDSSFVVQTDFASFPDLSVGLKSIAMQADGKMLVAGNYEEYFRRVGPNGEQDLGFDPGTITDGPIESMALQADGRPVIGGLFGKYNGMACGGIVRILNDPSLQTLSVPQPDVVRWMRDGSAPEVEQVVFERSADGLAWISIGAGMRITGGWELSGVVLPGSGFVRATGRTQAGSGSSLIQQVAAYSPAEIDVEHPPGTAVASGGPPVDLGSCKVSLSATRTFTIRNSGNIGLLLTGTPRVSITGANAGDFAVSALPASPVVPGSSTTFTVTFTPGAPGLRTASVSIPNSDADENPFSFTIQATGADPEIAVIGNGSNIPDGDNTPSLVDHTHFNSAAVGGGTVERTFTISNSGIGDLNLTGTPKVSISGAAAAEFSVVTLPASPVAAGGTTTFTVRFAPVTGGTRDATVSIANDDNDENPYDFAIRGTGTGPEINVRGNSADIADGDTTPQTADLTDFGSTAVSGGTVARTFNLTNTGTVGLNLTGTPRVAVSGSHAAEFIVSAQPTSPVGAGGSTTFTVTFDPAAPGLRMATLSISSDDFDETPYDFAIQGTGTGNEIAVSGNDTDIAAGDNTPSPEDHTGFGSIDVTSGSITHTFTIANTGNVALNLTGSPRVFLQGDNADFTVTALPATPVAGGGSTTFQITFNPVATGLRTAMVSVANDDGNENPFDFVIQGTGTAAEIAVSGNGVDLTDGNNLASTADHTDFGSVPATGGTMVRTFTITSSGLGPLSLTGTPLVSITGPNATEFTVTSQPATPLAAGSNTTFQITFDPATIGFRMATVSIANDDGDENPFDFPIWGTGTGSEMAVSGNSVFISDGDTTPQTADLTDFGSVNVDGSSLTRNFSIHNSGNVALNLTGTPVVTITGAHASEFIVISQPFTPVGTGGSSSFQILFDPAATGLRTATVSIANDDADENPYDFVIQGTGGIPEVAVSGNGVDITDGDTTPRTADHTDFSGAFVTSGTVARTFTISNSGTAPLSISGSPRVTVIGTHAADFTVTTQSGSTVPVGGSVTFTVSFDPAALGTRTATLRFNNSDSDESPFDFAIRGTGLTAQQSWRLLYFNTISNTGNAADLFDFDQDGLVNLIEFAFGLDPKANSAHQMPQAQRVGNELIVSFATPLGVSGITYGAQSSDTLAPNDWDAVSDTDLSPSYQFNIPIGPAPRTFLRLTVSEP